MKTADKIELALHRSELLRKGPSSHYGLTDACTIVSRHVARIARWRILECNGIQRWDEKAQGVFASWTDADQEKADKETAASRDIIQSELQPFLIRGCVWKFYTDPRAGVVLRIIDKANRRDCFLGGSF